MNFSVAGAGNRIQGFSMNTNTEPIKIGTESHDPIIKQESIEEKTEPMFGFGMFDEPMPDTSGFLSENEETRGVTSTTPVSTQNTTNSNDYENYYNNPSTFTEGGEFKEFASEMVKGDVKNYLRLGNAAWIEKRLERAAEHYKRATEIDSNEPRAWHNLAICNYHVALKRNPEDIEGAVQTAMGPLEMAKEKGGLEYSKTVENTLAYFAMQLGILQEEN